MIRIDREIAYRYARRGQSRDFSQSSLARRWVPCFAIIAALGPLTSYAQSRGPGTALAPVAIDASQNALNVHQQVTKEGPHPDLTLEFQRLDGSIASLTAKLDKKDYTAAWLGLIGVAVGAIATYMTQRLVLAHQHKLAERAAQNATEIAMLKASHDRELAANQATLEIGNSFVQWQLKQVSELYGPLHALFQQSHSLYRHMNSVLETKEPQKFRLRADETTDRIDKQVFEIQIDGNWERFRTVLHIDRVYGQGLGVDEYFDGIAAIGARIVKVIEENAGYARPEQPDLVVLFGRYLAHQAVLKQLVSYHRKRLENRALAATSMSVDDSAVFPSEIQSVVDSGYRAIVQDLNTWRARAFA